jgi:hypothetical protein
MFGHGLLKGPDPSEKLDESDNLEFPAEESFDEDGGGRLFALNSWDIGLVRIRFIQPGGDNCGHREKGKALRIDIASKLKIEDIYLPEK